MISHQFRLPVLLILAALAFMVSNVSARANNAAWSPWNDRNTSIIIDAYAYTPIDWGRLKQNRRLVGFINKASDGLVDPWRCGGSELQQNYCKVRWRRYKAEHELFLTRRQLAKALGLKWGSYHLGRPGNPVGQALHYLQYADPEPDDLLAIDIEHNDPEKWMSLKDAETFVRVIHRKIGRYPLLYTNHDTAAYIARNRDRYPLLSKLNLWYARYKDRIPGVFPLGHWDEYTMWQFSSIHNCSKRRCLYRVRGTDHTVDVNVSMMNPTAMRKAWPFNTLTAKIRPLKDDNETFVSAYAPEAVTGSNSDAQAAIDEMIKNADMVRRPEVVISGEIVAKSGELLARRYAPEEETAEDAAETDRITVAAIAPEPASPATSTEPTEAERSETATVLEPVAVPKPRPSQKTDAPGSASGELIATAVWPQPESEPVIAVTPEVLEPVAVPKPRPLNESVAPGSASGELIASAIWPQRKPQPVVAVEAAAAPEPAFRSLDSAPRFASQPKVIPTYRTLDQIHQLLTR